MKYVYVNYLYITIFLEKNSKSKTFQYIHFFLIVNLLLTKKEENFIKREEKADFKEFYLLFEKPEN